MARLPYVTGSAGVDFKTKSRATSTIHPPGKSPLVGSTQTETDRQMFASIALNLDIFDGFAMDARSAAARSRFLRAQDARDVLRRNLEGEVHQGLLAYNEAIERDLVARRALDSATENLKLTQEKYNVGSATILELIDAQVQLQRAQSDGVSALAAIRVAEAQIDRVRGRAE
jgi:outer membrane protein TolC